MSWTTTKRKPPLDDPWLRAIKHILHIQAELVLLRREVQPRKKDKK